jgi:phosphatidylinositol N-acetylglucosaminyltransferase subunit Q
MVDSEKLLRIFWPSDTARATASGVAVGWRNSEYDLFVVTVIQGAEVGAVISEMDVLLTTRRQPRNVDNALRTGILFRNSPHPVDRIFSLCGNPCLSALGTVNHPQPPRAFDPTLLAFHTEPSSKWPEVFCPRAAGVSVQIITYDQPLPIKMQYMSLTPISLALGDKSFDGSPRSLQSKAGVKQHLIEKLRLHTVIRRSSTQKELVLPVIINQINCSSELAQLMLKNVNLIGIRQRKRLSVSERVVESASNLWSYILLWIWHVVTLWLYPVVRRTFVLGLMAHRILAEIVLRVLEWRPRADSAALKDISATAQQIDIRLQQFCYWPIQYTTLRSRKDDWESITDRHPDYIRFYNSLWLVANDVIMGIALGSYIIDNRDGVAGQINTVLADWTLRGLKDMIKWLMDWPAGLKLNNELASFLGDLFLWVIEYWSCEWIASRIPRHAVADRPQTGSTSSCRYCRISSTS